MIRTPLDSFLKWYKETPNSVFLRQPINNEWHIYTYQRAGDEILKIVAEIKKFNLPPESNIAILSKNCAHWLMADLAIMLSGHISVPVYATLSASGINEILKHSEPALIFLGKLDNYNEQRTGIPDSIKKITFPFYGPQEGLKWEDITSHNAPDDLNILPGPDQLATIMYSSGTTGTPKGVMLTHGAFGFVGDYVMQQLRITKPERFFSYLPLSHIAERSLMEMVVLASGSAISFAESLEKFSENLQHEKPTIFGGVPRIYFKFQEGVLKKLPQHKLNMLLSIPIVSKIIKRSIRKKLGLAEARIIVSGAAPTPVTLIQWFKTIGIEIREIYGMTENTAYSHANFNTIKIGSVGPPLEKVKVKLGVDDEILIKHDALMKGYYKDKETTDLVFTEDGYLRTGDQGSIDDEGFLTITGRIKDQFKTDKAKFIAPAPIELKLLSDTNIEKVCVVGMGIPQPIALAVLSAMTKEKAKEVLAKELQNTILKVNETLESYERIESIVILKEDWTIENGLLTPSLKVKRNEIERIYLPKYLSWYNKKEKVIWE
jgi:long-chain acyl-CoA synthetase